MQSRECIVPGTLMKHFKGMLYQIITVATHSETSEEYVVYQALYGDYKTYVRPLAMFLGEVDRKKYPEVNQRYRFEVCKPEVISGKEIETKRAVEFEEDKEVVVKVQEDDNANGMKKEPLEKNIDVQQALLDFLDARSYKDKLERLEQMKRNIDSHIVNSMAISLDLLLVTEKVEEQLEEIRNCLLTHIRFEDRRLR